MVLFEAFGIGSGHINFFPVGRDARIIHGRGHGPGNRDETLDLLRVPSSGLEPIPQLVHILIRGAGKRTHKIGNNVLLFSRPDRFPGKHI